MRKTSFFAFGLWVICVLFSGILYAENNDPGNNLPDGMEMREVEPGYKLILPKGATIQKKGDLRVVEGSGEYAARKLAESDERFAKIEADIQALRKDIDEIKKMVGQTR